MYVYFARNFQIDIQARFAKLTNQSPPLEQDQIHRYVCLTIDIHPARRRVAGIILTANT
jgi:hypothetical protein